MIEKFTLTQKLLLASKIYGIGKKTILKLASDELFLRLDIDDWADYSPEFHNFVKGSPEYSNALKDTIHDINQSEKYGDSIISVLDKDFPQILKGQMDQPPILFVRGDLKKITTKAIAIIGTREPSDHGKVITERITQYFSHNSWQIVSGLAIGIDSLAHQATLHSNGSTVAVLANGLDTIFPKSNLLLSENIVANGGLLMSEYSYNTKTFPSNFVERDKIQAALSQAVIMIQSGTSGGSLHASRAILRYGRNLIVPYPTKKDIYQKHPKIEANLTIANGSTQEKTHILKCKPEDLDRVIILRNKEEYFQIEQNLKSIMQNQI